jgi:hypothetical protein
VLRVENRLPFRQVTRLLADTLGLSVCAAAVARQVQRLGRWLGGEYEHLKTRLRSGQVAYADETGHRDDGRNGWLWTVSDERHTLYHVDKSRGGKVIRGLLGEAFGGTLVCDFYGGYDAMNCRKQRCNTHLLRELRDTAKGSRAFASHPFHRRCKRLVKDLLSLKRRWEELSDNAYTSKACRLEDRLERLARAVRGRCRSGRQADRRPAAAISAGAHRLPLGPAGGRHQQRRRAGAAPGRRVPQDHRRHPQRRRRQRLGGLGLRAADRAAAGPRRIGNAQDAPDELLGRRRTGLPGLGIGVGR